MLWASLPDLQAAPSQKDTGDLLIAQLSESVSVVRINAALALGAQPDIAVRSVPALAAMISDPDNRVATSAARALGALGGLASKAAPELLTMLASQNPGRRQAATQALIMIRPAGDVVDPLVASLQEDDDGWGAQESAAEALGVLAPDSPRARSALVSQLSGPSSKVAAAAVKALASMGAAGRGEAIRGLNHGRVEVRRSAAAAFAGQDDIGAAIPALYAALQDSDGAVRRTACVAIRKFRGATEDMLLRDPCPK